MPALSAEASQLRDLQDACREVARDLRARALAVDTDPLDMARHLDAPALALVRTASTPERFRAAGDHADVPHAASCLARTVATVELARGDAGLLVANTGPALAGVAVDALGSEAQQEAFYDVIADGRTWTFFGMTEAERGSDATALQTRLDRTDDGYLLHGAKRYISNGARGAIGVVFARTGPSALHIRAALVHTDSPGFHAERLDMLGLRGAQISALRFDAVPVPADCVLGAHLPASRRGIWGAGRSFNTMRAQIAAMALGVAYAAADELAEHRPAWDGLDLLRVRLDAGRALLVDAATTLDHAPDDRAAPSLAKLHLTDLAVRTTRTVAAALGPGALLDHPLLEKWCRDVHAFEFMDGTSNVLRLHAVSDLAQLAAPVPPRRS